MKKIIAPIVIAALVILYFIFWGVGLIQIAVTEFSGMLIGLVIPLGLCGVMIYVTIQRIKEIRSGEEDDLSKY